MGSNRTFIELKSLKLLLSKFDGSRSNRTFMELKYLT